MLPLVKSSISFASHIKIHWHIYLETFWAIFTCKLCLIWAYFSPDSDKKAIQSFEVKKHIYDEFVCSFSLHDINWWTGVIFVDVFISYLDSHSEGTHSLQRIHWWASDVKLFFFFMSSDEETLIYILHLYRWSKLSANVHFWMTYSFNALLMLFKNLPDNTHLVL